MDRWGRNNPTHRFVKSLELVSHFRLVFVRNLHLKFAHHDTNLAALYIHDYTAATFQHTEKPSRKTRPKERKRKSCQFRAAATP